MSCAFVWWATSGLAAAEFTAFPSFTGASGLGVSGVGVSAASSLLASGLSGALWVQDRINSEASIASEVMRFIGGLVV